jgi:peptide/nickel transport system ATP-binding protein
LPPIIEVEDLRKYFAVQKTFLDKLTARQLDYVKAVDGVSFEIERGSVFGLVGESGSGKTTTGRILARLEEPSGGKIVFDGRDLLAFKGSELRRLHKRIQMIFQDPSASLNPRMKIGDALGHGLRIQRLADSKEARKRVLGIMETVGLAPAEALYEKYPHQLSGGQKQRAVIGRALILEPEFVVADEPIAMVDVSVRALILELMMRLKAELNLTYLFITHDLATAKYICDAIAIMYLGQIIESGPSAEIFKNPIHPYTIALMSAIPVPDPKARTERMIPRGEIPNPINPPSGCRFHPRCPFVMEMCRRTEPQLVEVASGHRVACHLAS